MARASPAFCAAATAALVLQQLRCGFAALCDNWDESTCANSNDGGCSCAWSSRDSQCYRTDSCDGFGITSVVTCDASESCMDADAAAECRAMMDACGDEMMVLESCPQQFQCPLTTTLSPTGSIDDATTVTPTTQTPTASVDEICNENDACMNADNAAYCRQLAAACGVNNLIIMESCPAQFSCPCQCGSSCDGNGICLADGLTCGNSSSAPDCSNFVDDVHTSGAKSVPVAMVSAAVLAAALAHLLAARG